MNTHIEALEAADKVYRAASEALYKASDDYRAGLIGDAEYLAARKARDDALKVWEAAEAAALASGAFDDEPELAIDDQAVLL